MSYKNRHEYSDYLDCLKQLLFFIIFRVQVSDPLCILFSLCIPVNFF